MKQKFAIINIVLSVAVLFSVLFQSIHSYVHQSEINSEKLTTPENFKSKLELSQQHTINIKCAVCDFQFSCFTASEFFMFKFIKTIVINKLTAIVLQQPSPYFIGSLFALRAPPAL